MPVFVEDQMYMTEADVIRHVINYLTTLNAVIEDVRPDGRGAGWDIIASCGIERYGFETIGQISGVVASNSTGRPFDAQNIDDHVGRTLEHCAKRSARVDGVDQMIAVFPDDEVHRNIVARYDRRTWDKTWFVASDGKVSRQ